MNTVKTTTAAWAKNALFVKTMTLMGAVSENGEILNEEMINFALDLEGKKKEVSGTVSAETKAARAAKAKKRAEGLHELAAELGFEVPKSAIALDVTERSVAVLGEDGKKTGEKATTGHLVKLVYGERGNTRELRGTVSVGGEKNPKSDDQIDDEIAALKRELFENLLKIVG